MRSLIDQEYKNPYAIVRVEGSVLRDVLSIEVNKSYENTISSATVNVANKPFFNPEAKIVIELGYNNQTHTVFTGYVDTIEYNEADNEYQLSCRDVLKRAVDTFFVQEVAFGIDVDQQLYYYSTYSDVGGGTFRQHVYTSLAALNANHPETVGNYSNQGVYAEAVVQWLLVMCGFAEGSEIQVRPTNFWIGDIQPARFHLTTAFDAINQIAELIGWRIYADRSGIVRFTERQRNPSGYAAWTYALNRKNILSLNISTSNTDLRNYVEVRGYSGIVSVARAPSPYIGNVPYRGVLIANELIDTQDMANFMAARVLTDLNRLKETINLEVDGNPLLEPGDTIAVNASTVYENYRIVNITHNISADGYFTKIFAERFPGDVNYQEPPVEITAAYRVVNLAVFGDPRYVAEFDASASYSNRGDITRYIWTIGSNPPEEYNYPRMWAVFNETDITNSNSVNVTLQVYDEYGNTATTTSGITLDWLRTSFGGKEKKRALYVAATNTAQGSDDGGLTWNSLSLPAISCAASNFGPNQAVLTSGYALFGGSNGAIYRTEDACRTGVTVLQNAGSAVNWVSIMELDSRYAIAGTQGGRIYRSQDFGKTWTLLYTFSFPIREVRYGFNDPSYIHVVGSGANNVYHSFNGGVSWARVSDSIGLVNREQSGAVTNYYSTVSGILALGSGYLTFQYPPGSINTHTVAVDDDRGVMAVSASGQHWVMSGTTMVPTQSNPSNTAGYMIRDGELLPVVYYAIPSGVGKSLNRNQTMEILHTTPQTGLVVAYGPFSEPPPPDGDVLVIMNRSVVNDNYLQPPWGPISRSNSNLFLHTVSGWMLLDNNIALWSYHNYSARDGYFAYFNSDWTVARLLRMRADMTISRYANWIANVPSENTTRINLLFRSNSAAVCLQGNIFSGRLARVIYFPNALTNSTQSYYDGIMTITDTSTTSRVGYSHTAPNVFTDTFCVTRRRFHISGASDIVLYYPSNQSIETVYSSSRNDYINLLLQTPESKNPTFFYSNEALCRKVTSLNASRVIANLQPFGTTPIWQSFQPGVIYINDSKKIYKITNYGEGQTSVIFNVDDFLHELESGNWYLRTFTCTPSLEYKADYIAAVVGAYQGWDLYWYIYHSNDGGKTWKRTRSFVPNTSTRSYPLAFYVPRT